jgi:hypothetical protein
MPPDLERLRRICANAAAARALAAAGAPEPEPDEAADTAMATRAIIEVYALDNPPAPLDRLSPEDRRRFRP